MYLFVTLSALELRLEERTSFVVMSHEPPRNTRWPKRPGLPPGGSTDGLWL
jgi:hypothetical protein